MPLNQTSMEFYISRKMFDSMINKKCLHFFFKQIKKKKIFFLHSEWKISVYANEVTKYLHNLCKMSASKLSTEQSH